MVKLVLALLFLAGTLHAQRTDVIRGRVTGTDGVPIVGVNVSATSYSGGVTQSTRTDRNGRYTIIIANGEGDYWMSFASIGHVPRRFEIKRVADEEVLVAEARLTSRIATLDAVNVTANAPRALPPRTDATTDVSGTDRTLASQSVSPDMTGNLAALAALNPGIQFIPGLDGASDAFSALGIAPEQNNTTYNGMGSSLTTLPRDVQATASLRTFNYDPAVGGFGGAQISITTRPGTNYSSRFMSALARGPASEVTTEIAEDQAAKNTFLSLGGAASGAFVQDRSFYSVSYQADRDYRDLRTVANTSTRALSAAGVNRDSVTRLLGILDVQGIPARVTGVPSLQATNRFALQGNVDFAPQSSGAGDSFGLSFAGSLAETENAGAALSTMLSAPGHNVESRVASANFAVRHYRYFWFGILSTTTLGVSASVAEMLPDERLPQGTVRVRSDLDDGTSAIRTLSFGRSPVDQSSHGEALELLNQMSWYEGNNRHVFKLTSNLRYERNVTDRSSNMLGSFSFGSLADLEAGQPELFSRSLSARRLRGDQLVASLALGDVWRPNSKVQVQLGARVDGNWIASAPAYNVAVADAFGYRTDHVPNRIAISPRLGFQWLQGQTRELGALLSAARPPRAVIRGGIGLFQNVAPVALMVNPVINSTGLPDAEQNIRCAGPAVPIPDWNAYRIDEGSIPRECADGSNGTGFGTTTPNVMLYDREYRQARVLRSNLAWSGPVLDNRFAFGLSLQYQRGFNQPATADINLGATTRFVLSSENARPVFAPPEAIVPGSGAIAASASRVDSRFDRVNVLQSDLQQETQLVSMSLRPAITNSTFDWTIAYTWQHAREQFLGFSSNVGDPFQKTWSNALGTRTHTVNATLFHNAFDLFRINASFALVSGARFTPVVLGDINGDGIATNDRAFVFDPALSTDSSLGARMQQLLAHGGSSARACLSAQTDAFAARGSCRGPWQAVANINIGLNTQKLGLPRRMRVTLNINNPLVLADILANGQTDVRGWGQLIAPDPVLLSVRGFDPSARNFRYEVNERFGSTRPFRNVQRAQTFLSLNVSYDIGVPRELQVLTQRLDNGRTRQGTKETVPTLRALGASTIPNPIALILQQSDSLQLTRRQADSLVSLNRAYESIANELWSDVATKLAALPDEYDRREAQRIYGAARERTVDHLIRIAPRVKAVLTPAQQRRLPQNILNWLDVRVLRAVRSSTIG